jgi:hypothetical protein
MAGAEAGVDEILTGHRPEVVKIAQALRAVVLETLPEETSERAYPGWHGIGYRHPVAGHVCGIFPLEDRVKLGFERGVELYDPDDVLGGEGTPIRYLEVRTAGEIPLDALRGLLDEADALGAERRRPNAR